MWSCIVAKIELRDRACILELRYIVGFGLVEKAITITIVTRTRIRALAGTITLRYRHIKNILWDSPSSCNPYYIRTISTSNILVLPNSPTAQTPFLMFSSASGLMVVSMLRPSYFWWLTPFSEERYLLLMCAKCIFFFLTATTLGSCVLHQHFYKFKRAPC